MYSSSDTGREFSNKAYLNMELLRFTTAGSVDDGKSTLIGRLLYDSKSIFEDQLDAVRRASLKKGGEHINLALLTDGLRAEREQGITIDVAYRYFATPHRKFIIADTPGHIQYTRNMVTGASTANAAIILIDARNGVTEQTHRHSYIASLLGIQHIIICINKMDLVNFQEDVYNKIYSDYRTFADKAFPSQKLWFIPISALFGDNVVKPSTHMPWFKGGTLLNVLETVPINNDHSQIPGRFPVQYIIRPENSSFPDYRGYAGRITGGIFHKGEKVTVLPSYLTTKITSIDTFDGSLDEAFPPMSVTIRLENDIDISRGSLIVPEKDLPTESNNIEIMLCWLNPKPLELNKKYGLKQATTSCRCLVHDIPYILNINTLEKISDGNNIRMNDIACVHIRTTQPLFFDPYTLNRTTGSLIMIDEGTNETVGAGMIVQSC
ncbi:MAG: GTP-binding protein [Bacteroidota bacterium]|nr:GTP-binding protein [Bacteroidota bacterium]